MDEIKRYACFHCDGMEPHTTGGWVLYTDYLKMKEELEKLK